LYDLVKAFGVSARSAFSTRYIRRLNGSAADAKVRFVIGSTSGAFVFTEPAVLRFDFSTPDDGNNEISTFPIAD
jgi:hypothetical protein